MSRITDHIRMIIRVNHESFGCPSSAGLETYCDTNKLASCDRCWTEALEKVIELGGEYSTADFDDEQIVERERLEKIVHEIIVGV